MVDIQTEQLRRDFMGYLKWAFGEEFLRWVSEPKGVQIGERVLYKLRVDKKAKRKELSKPEAEALRQQMVELAKSTGGVEVTFDPPISSGLSYPRLIDLPGSAIMWDKDLKQYIDSDDLLPSDDFSLEWVIGVLNMWSQKMILYLDFAHPKVKAIFRVFYDSEYDSRVGEPGKTREKFRQFREKEAELKVQIENSTDVVWAKVVQMDMEPLCVKIRKVT